MVYAIEKVMRDVRVCLDENMSSDALLREADIDTLSLDDIVRSKIEDAVRTVEMTVPVEMLEPGHNFGDAVHWGDKESGWVLLPADFMRLIVFEMSDWERSVSTAITEGSAEYALQRQRVKALRGTAQRPVCALVNRPEGLSLEFYSCRSEDAYVSRGVYLPAPRIDRHGGIEISRRCYRSAVYMAAGMVLATLGDKEKSALMVELSKNMMV